MSPWGNNLTLLGNPENRRITEFAREMSERGLAPPRCVSYLDFLRDPSCLAGDLVRIDSPGENEEVASELAGARLQPGQIGRLREYHAGFCALLQRVEARCLNAPRDIATMFDKWACHERFVQAGLPRPRSEIARDPFTRPAGRVFLKPLHGSSASGVCALRWNHRRVELTAPIELAPDGLFNSLRVRSYTKRAEVERILGELLPQGMIVEQWIPKLTLPGGAVDLRVLVIAGRARHRVVRQSRHPMTNLHLGNRRGDEGELRSALGEERFERALELAERAAACFPDSLYAGVDILIDTAGRSLIGEINAFGDLLPGLVHEGETPYGAILGACLDPSRPV